MNQDHQDLYVAYIGDGYLAAAGESEAQLRDYMTSLGESFSMTLLLDVPREIADALKRQGSSDQHYSDGYEAAARAAPYAPADAVVENYDEPDEERDDREYDVQESMYEPDDLYNDNGQWDDDPNPYLGTYSEE